MGGMGNTVSRSAKMDTKTRTARLQKQMIIRASEIGLQQIMINILTGRLDGYALNPHCFECLHGERA